MSHDNRRPAPEVPNPRAQFAVVIIMSRSTPVGNATGF